MAMMDLSAGTAASDRAKGRTSISLEVEAWAAQRAGAHPHKVTSAAFVMVAIGDDGKPRPVD
jgi:acyl-CoA thioesterase YciA